MNPQRDSPSLAAKLMSCMAEAGEKHRARNANVSTLLQKTLKRHTKRDARWLNKIESVIDSIEKRLEAKGPLAALAKLFFRRSRRIERDLLRLLSELHKRDREQHEDLIKLDEALNEGSAGGEDSMVVSDRAEKAVDKSILVMVDLRGIDASGINGGLQSYVIWLMKWLCSRHRADFSLIAIARWPNHELVASLFGGEDAVLIEADHSQFLRHGDERHPPTLTTSVPLEELATRMNVEVLYCPFGPLTFHREGIRSIALIADLLHRELPACLPPETRWMRERHIKRAASEATFLQCISHSSQERLEFHFPAAAGKTFFTYLPIQERLMSASVGLQDSGAGLSLPYFFYPANFWPHKNHRVLLVAYQIYVNEAGEGAWDLVLSGSDYEGEAGEIRRFAASLGVSHKVRIMGYVSDSELAGLWRHAAALVFPSLHEGFGIPLLEAMRCGVPILCGPDYSLNEIGGDAVCYFNPRKPLQVAARMKELAGNPELAARLRMAGSERLARFHADEEAERLVLALKGQLPIRADAQRHDICGCPK